MIFQSATEAARKENPSIGEYSEFIFRIPCVTDWKIIFAMSG